MFTRSAITPPKMNRFGWNLEPSAYIVGGCIWQFLGAIHAIAVWEAGKIFCPVNNARFGLFPVSQISRNLNTTTPGRHNCIMITDRWKFTTKWSLYGVSSFHFYRQNQFKMICLRCTLRTRNLPQILCDVRRPFTSDTTRHVDGKWAWPDDVIRLRPDHSIK